MLKTQKTLDKHFLNGNFAAYGQASDELRENLDNAKKAVLNGFSTWVKYPASLRENQEFLNYLLDNKLYMAFGSLISTDEKTFTEDMCKQYITHYLVETLKSCRGYNLKWIIERFHDNRDMAKFIFSNMDNVPGSSSYFCLLDDELRDDEDFVKELAEKTVSILGEAGGKLRANRDFMIEMVKKNPDAYQYSSPELFEDEEVAEIAVTAKASNIVNVEPTVTNYKALALAAVKVDGTLIQFLHNLTDDEDVAREAINQNGIAYLDLSSRLQAKQEFVEIGIKSEAAEQVYHAAPDCIKADESIAIEALKNGAKYIDVPFTIAGNKELLRVAVKNDDMAIYYGMMSFSKVLEELAAEEKTDALEAAKTA